MIKPRGGSLPSAADIEKAYFSSVECFMPKTWCANQQYLLEAAHVVIKRCNLSSVFALDGILGNGPCMWTARTASLQLYLHRIPGNEPRTTSNELDTVYTRSCQHKYVICFNLIWSFALIASIFSMYGRSVIMISDVWRGRAREPHPREVHLNMTGNENDSDARCHSPSVSLHVDTHLKIP